MSTRMTATALALAALTGCCSQPTRVVEVPTVVEVPGPVQWREISEDLLKCDGRPEALRDGITGGELRSRARGWQAYAICLEGRLQSIKDLPETSRPDAPD